MSCIQKRLRAGGGLSYRVRVKYRGRVLSSTHRDRAKAERWAAERGALIRDDFHFAGESNRRRLLGDVIDRYVEHVLPQKRDRANPKRQLRWWKRRLGTLSVQDVTRADIALARDELLTKGAGARKRCGPATTVRYLAALSHVFSVAINDWQWADVNPVKGIRRPREPRGRDRYLLDEERVQLLTACKESKSPDLYDFVMLALSTGMRRGEVESLEWRDIDFARAVITLRDTKNGTRRGIPLRGPIVEILQHRAKTRKQRVGLVFPGNDSTQPIDLTTPWRTAVRRAGIEDFRMHDLRHTAASYLAMNGASSLEIAAILGHKTLQMTKRYAHLSVDHLGGVLERLNQGAFGHV